MTEHRGAGEAGPRITIRHARPEDLPDLEQLAAEHAAYEKAAPPPGGLAERLAALLFGPEREATTGPRALRCLVAAPAVGPLAGYATCTPEFATWQGAEYLHMDCLYLRPEHRGAGLGTRLMAAIVGEAEALGLTQVQWNTPAWNEGAIRFYDRLGGTNMPKLRYSLTVPVPPTPPVRSVL
ncbi:GNAT family N-acetyltransferase [Streptomyces botrytidirepellens]|uniref:GNAT family N-acetyltransferase n=1 Tax=Streptomyces botrytidirepellens TaxID=2486417 RepID=A0A3M8SQ31_9ACTN|nr:GNAT family N-acetyltransferase [Streptomyces botrytidirepellens]RNF83421.1 GNAT family N-acetyltransferase [Streptomyces botrytidirepellens]